MHVKIQSQEHVVKATAAAATTTTTVLLLLDTWIQEHCLVSACIFSNMCVGNIDTTNACTDWNLKPS